MEIQNYQQQVKKIETEIADYQARLNLTPATEQELADISRGYEESKANYNSLLQKQNQSQLATSLEERQQGEQFRILDPPSLPTRPSAPNHLLISLAGLVVGFAVGAGLMAFLEITNVRVRQEKDLEEAVPLKVLIGIPHLDAPGEDRARALFQRLELGAVRDHGDFDRGWKSFRVLQKLRTMYKEFYGLTRNPFEVSPDPFFFYPTPRHTEALANLAYGVLRRKGFVVLTGEVGTGKTLLVRCLLDALTKNKVAFAYMYNPMISVPEFLHPCD